MQSTYDKIQYYKLNSYKKEALSHRLKELLAKNNKVKAAWIFGSFTKNDTIRDIDVAINTEKGFSFAEYLALNAELELEMGLPVDLVEIKKAPDALRQRIYSGIIIK